MRENGRRCDAVVLSSHASNGPSPSCLLSSSSSQVIREFRGTFFAGSTSIFKTACEGEWEALERRSPYTTRLRGSQHFCCALSTCPRSHEIWLRPIAMSLLCYLAIEDADASTRSSSPAPPCQSRSFPQRHSGMARARAHRRRRHRHRRTVAQVK